MKKINPGKIYTRINISAPNGGPSLKAYYHQKCLVVILEDSMTDILLNSSTVLLISTHQSYSLNYSQLVLGFASVTISLQGS